MKAHNLGNILQNNTYPGRGILIGRSQSGGCMVTVYFIMGRSVNSRNRVFEKTEDGIRTKAFDPAQLTDPSLVIYRPVRTYNGQTIVTNGDQTETILTYLKNGNTFRAALLTREFEPDKPHFTPRISGLVHRDGSYELSILKSLGDSTECCCRYFFEYSAPMCGIGHFISTYRTDGDPLPSFEGEPFTVEINTDGGLSVFAERIWDSLNQENKVALYARETDLATGESFDVVFNSLT